MSGCWWRVTITGRPGDGDAIAAAIVRVTGNGVEELHPGTVRTTVAERSEAESLGEIIAKEFTHTTMEITGVDVIDWSTGWRDGIVARQFGRLTLTPSWLMDAAPPGALLISIDPESAFGSGEHGSTRGALALLERWIRANDRVLDLGSGSGILAIAAARLGARSAVGIEVDEESLPIAEANAVRNDVTTRVRFLVGDAGELSPLCGPADLICSNILRTVNVSLIPAILASLAPAGTVIFSGMEEPEAALFIPHLEAHDLRPIDEQYDDGWWSVAATRA